MEIDLFERWKEVEGVAMHFNELILGFRTQALAAVSVAGGISTAVLTKGEPDRLHFRLLGWVLGLLLALWAAIFFLDSLYYQKLLRGAVDEAKRLEAESAGALQMSTAIEMQFEGCWKGHHLFYSLPAVALLVGLTLCFWRGGKSKNSGSGPPS